jgi:hypothetical protein
MSQEHDPEPETINQPEPGMCWGPWCKRPAVTEWFCGPVCYENWTRQHNKTSDCHDRPHHGANIDRYIESPYRSYTEWRNAQRGVEDEEDCE